MPLPALAAFRPAVALIALLALPADAFELGPDGWQPCLGLARCTVGPLTLAAEGAGGAPGRLVEQVDRARGAVAALGVDHDPGNGFNEAEIQGPVGERGGERLVVMLSPPQPVALLALAYLFSPAQVADDPEEQARVTAWAGGTVLGTVEVTSRADGTLRVAGPAGKVRTVSADAGLVEIAGPFGGQAVERLEFHAPAVAGGDTSDYALARIVAGPPG